VFNGALGGTRQSQPERRRRDLPPSYAFSRAWLRGSGLHGVGPVADIRARRNGGDLAAWRPRAGAAGGGCGRSLNRALSWPGGSRRAGAWTGRLVGNHLRRCSVHSRRDDGKFRPRNLHGALAGGAATKSRTGYSIMIAGRPTRLSEPRVQLIRRSLTCRISRGGPAGPTTTVAAFPARCVPAIGGTGTLSTTQYNNPMCHSVDRHR
jgi:hypothetical protein